MSRRHESTLCSALEHFIQQTIPEYITDTGKMIVAENGISNLLWHMEDTYSQASCTCTEKISKLTARPSPSG